MPISTPLKLSPDTIDDLLYFARTNSLSDLQSLLSLTATLHATTPPAILSATLDPDTRNGPLHMASANGHTETLRYILSLLPSPDPNPSAISSPPPLPSAQNLSGNTPLHYACLNGHLEAAKLLLAAGADPAVLNTPGHDAVYEAERNGKEEVGRWVLMEGRGMERGVGGKGVEDEEGGGTDAPERKDGVVGGEKEVEDGMRELGIGEQP